jgi:hypothetical protein
MERQFAGANFVPIDAIEAGVRLRTLNARQVAALKDSIETTVLLNPITVYLLPKAPEEGSRQTYGLIAGAHRLEACRSLGWHEIAVHVVEIGELQRQIAECDENLCGSKLSAAERAKLTAQRKEAYEALHPETRNGAAGNGRKKLRQIGEATRFTSDTAARTGKSERSVQRDAERGSAIDPEILEAVRHTNLDKGRVLDALAATPRDDQAAMLAEIRGQPPRDGTSRAPRRGNSDLGTARPAIEPGPSAAAVWIVARLGQAHAALFSHMLADEDPGTFVVQLGTLTRSLEPAEEVTNLSEHVPEGTVSSICRDTAGTTPVIGTGIVPDTGALEPMMTLFEPADGPPAFSAAASSPGCGPTMTEGLSGAHPLRHDSRRPSNWRDVADVPQNGDWCRECKGTDWWGGSSERSGWYCASCFEVPSYRRARLLHWPTAPLPPGAEQKPASPERSDLVA